MDTISNPVLMPLDSAVFPVHPDVHNAMLSVVEKFSEKFNFSGEAVTPVITSES